MQVQAERSDTVQNNWEQKKTKSNAVTTLFVLVHILHIAHISSRHMYSIDVNFLSLPWFEKLSVALPIRRVPDVEE